MRGRVASDMAHMGSSRDTSNHSMPPQKKPKYNPAIVRPRLARRALSAEGCAGVRHFCSSRGLCGIYLLGSEIRADQQHHTEVVDITISRAPGLYHRLEQLASVESGFSRPC